MPSSSSIAETTGSAATASKTQAVTFAARWRWYRRKLGLLAERTFPPLERLRERRRLIGHYTRAHGKPPRLDPPVTFNEKIIAASLTDHHPLLALYSDKIAVRDYVASRIGAEWVLPLLGAWWRAEDIDWEALPESFVLKPSHSSGQILKVEEKARLDRARVTATLRGWLAHDFYRQGPGEWRYRDIPPRILAEPLLPNAPDGGSPPDHSVFVFNGEPRFLKVVCGRHVGDTKPRATWFDLVAREPLPFRHNGREPLTERMPADFDWDGLAALARLLSADFDAMRVDFLWVNGRHWFGELTPTDNAGTGLFDPPEWDEIVGRAWPLRDGKAYIVRPGVPAPRGYPPQRP